MSKHSFIFLKKLQKSNNMQEPSTQKNRKKRSGSPLEDSSTSAKRIKLDVSTINFSNNQIERSYAKDGSTRSLHGIVYQLKLLMLFVKRALDENCEFSLATELIDAEKFDDIVFKYQSDKIRFVQVKHKQDDSKKITAHDLLILENARGNNDFSLQKYFTSFQKIKKNPVFNKYELVDLIIYTNIDFNYSDLENAEIQLTNSDENDDAILRVHKSKKTALRYKLFVEEKHKLYQILMQASDLYLLAESLTNHLHTNLPIKRSKDIWQRYHVPLRQSVFTIENEKETEETKKQNSEDNVYLIFRDDFVGNRNLPESVSNFRKVLKSFFDNKDDDTAFTMKLRESKLSVPSNFGEVFNLTREPWISNPVALAKLFARNSSKAEEKVSIKRNVRVVQDNIDKLAGHVLVLDDNSVRIRFRKMFFDDNHELAGNLNDFKKALKAELAKEGVDFNKLREYRYKIANFNTYKETSEGELLASCEMELPNDIKSEITEFFDKLSFAVNQPDEVELGNIIAEELGESSQFNLLNPELVKDSFEREMLDWFKEKRGRFLDNEDGLKLFKSIEQKVNRIICIGLSFGVCDNLEKYDIKFDKNDVYDYLKTFLDTISTSPKILHLVTSKITTLSEMKLHSALESLKMQDAQYKRQDSYIFMKLDALLQLNSQRIALGAFEASGSYHLLIILCNCTKEEVEIQKLYNQLSEILQDINNKKTVILIAEEDDILVQKFPANQVDNFRSTTTFDNLTDESKKKLLGKEVIFQGEKEGLRMKQLFTEEDGNNIIDSETLVQLITNDTISVGSKLLGKSDLEGAYNKIYESIDKDLFVRILRESTDPTEFFVVSGLERVDKVAFIQKHELNENEICEVTLKNDMLEIKVLKNVIFADSKFEKHHFKQLCDRYSNNSFKWIKWEVNKFVLFRLYNPTFLKRQFKYPNKIAFSDDIKVELLYSNEDNVFFFTGLDKPEHLFEVLNLQDENEKEMLIKNIESGKVQTSSSSTNESAFNDLAQEKAKENKFVYWLDVANNHDDEKLIIWRDVSRKTIFEENLIATLENQSTIIIDKPGMGKSTTLAILSEKMLTTHWVIFITLRDWQETLNNLPEKIDNDVVIDFLTNTKNLNTSLEKNLAKFLLDKEREGGLKPLLLMLDGFDEIRSYDAENASKKKVVELITFLKENTRCTLWITAREQDVIQLQNILSLFCVKFEPLKKDEYCDYFQKFWWNSLKLSVTKEQFDDKFQSYYNALSKAADAIFANKENDFMGIPLTLRLFAEGFQDKFKEFVCSEESTENFGSDFDNLSILKLYKFFVGQKFLIFIREKTNLSTGFTKTSEDWFRQKLIKLHCRLAFKELFGEDETKELLGLKIPFEGEEGHVDRAQLEELLNIGIIRSIKVDHYEFLHRTIAEYFTSRLLIYILKNKRHNNLAKYKRTKQFLRNNILKQSNVIIKNFLNAEPKLDDVLKPMLEDIKYLESKNLLDQVKPKYSFVLNKENKDKKPGDLNDIINEIKQEFEHLRKSEDKSTKRKIKNTSFESIICKKFKPSFLYETDVEKLQNSLKYLMYEYGRAFVRPQQLIDNSINILLRDNIPDFISHYILRAEEQNKLDKDFVEHCFKIIFNNREDIRIVENTIADDKSSKNTIIDRIFASGILTTKIADVIINRFDTSGAAYMFFHSLISPLLSFKYFCSKYSFVFVNRIDSAALLRMFHNYAYAYRTQKNNMDLSLVPLEGILYCIQESLNRVKFSRDSFTNSVKALIALGYWGFQLSYTNNTLNLIHDEHGYKSELNLKYEENIIGLLKFQSKPDFDAELAATANNLSVATPASI